MATIETQGETARIAPQIALEQLQAANELRGALRSFIGHGDATVRRCGLTPQRYQLLLAVQGAPDGSGSRSVGDLADDLQLAQSSVTELVDRAVAAGLVLRETAAHDGRVVRVRLSPVGQARLAEAFASLRAERERLLERLDAVRVHLERTDA
jgi:DNA-binding MarR family transcriptional regulator